MAQQNRSRRPRGRNNNQNRQKFINKNQAFDSSGPQGRVRGNAQQVYEKYQALARDAQAANEHTLAEAHFQHAEHYLRLYNEMLEQIEVQRAEKAKRDEERAVERGTREQESSESAASTENTVTGQAEVLDLGASPQPSVVSSDEKPISEESAA
ncbi:MAG: DUF4167 domain-containing protein [Alphaproteobacteria bacterium]